MSTLKTVFLLFTLLVLSSCGGLNLSQDPSGLLSRRASHLPETAEPLPAKYLREAAELIKSGDTAAAQMILWRVKEQYPGTPWYGRALFLTERVFIQLEQDEEADAAMLRVQSEYPELADYAVFILAEYYYAQERYSKAATLYQLIPDRYPKSLLTVRSLFLKAQALLKAEAYLQAQDSYEKFLNDNPRSEFAPAAALGLGRALRGQWLIPEATKTYLDVLIKYPGTPLEQDVEDELAELRKSNSIPGFSPEDIYDRGKNLYRSKQYGRAFDTFSQLDMSALNPQYQPDVLFMNGIAAFNSGRRNEATVSLQKLIRQYPDDPRIPEALNWLGKSYSRLGDWERGSEAFQKILDRFSESEWADDALFLLGNINRETGDVDKSLSYYETLVKKYPQSKFADSALWWQAWLWYAVGDYQKAMRCLQRLTVRYPRSFLVHQARYWQGKMAEKIGDFHRARTYYLLVLKKGLYTFYGYRAAERIAFLEDLTSVQQRPVPDDEFVICKKNECSEEPVYSYTGDETPPVWTEETRSLLTADPAFKKTLDLLYVDMKTEASAELWSLQEKFPAKRGAQIGLSKAFFELGDFYRSHILVIKKYERYLETPDSSTPEDLWRLAYPLAYWNSILSYARKYGQDPYFIAAIIKEESQFKTDALSPAGARGLMQVMPATGMRVAQQIKLPKFNREKLYEVDTVINIGAWYISHLMKRYKGDPFFVAAAYNAGPDAASQWIKKNINSNDRDAFVESIPYMETRGYVKKVMRNYFEYKRIYGKTAEVSPLVPVLPTDSIRAVVVEKRTKKQ